MVAAVRQGASLRAVARRIHVSLQTVQRWVQRASGRRLDRVDWSDRPHVAHTIHRTDAAVEDLVLLSGMIANSHYVTCLHTTCQRNTSQVTCIL